jgi:hypothetical protein
MNQFQIEYQDIDITIYGMVKKLLMKGHNYYVFVTGLLVAHGSEPVVLIYLYSPTHYIMCPLVPIYTIHIEK